VSKVTTWSSFTEDKADFNNNLLAPLASMEFDLLIPRHCQKTPGSPLHPSHQDGLLTAELSFQDARTFYKLQQLTAMSLTSASLAGDH